MSQFSTVERLQAAPAERESAPMVVSGGPQGFTLRRTGRRPVFFEGVELCMAMSYVPGAAFWYEINIYRTVSDGFVVYVRLFSKKEQDTDLYRVFEAGSFEEVISFLEDYDAAEDVRIDVLADDQSAPLSELVVRALALRARIDDARRQFSALVGQILFDIDS